MIDTNARPTMPAAPSDAVPGMTGGPAEGIGGGTEERSVNLGQRFFNARTAVSFLIGVAVLVWVFRASNIHPGQIWEEFQQVDGRIYALAIATYATTFLFRGLRWQRLLHNVGSDLPVVPLTEVIFLSWFVNSIVPAKLGDLYRGYLLRREYGLSMSRTVGTVVAERVVDILALILLLGSTGYFVLRQHVSPDLDYLMHWGWGLFAVLLVGMFAAARYGERLVRFLPHRFHDMYDKFAHGTFSSLNPVPLILVLTALAWTAEAGRLYFVMRSLHHGQGVGIGPLGALFTAAAISLALIAPTPGGLGAVEGAFVLILTVFAVPRDVALTVAVLDRVISYYSLILIGLPTFLLSKRGR